jgi:glycopeptide antibiotics resistance protein
MKSLIALASSVIVILAGSLYPFKLRVPSDGIGPVAALFESWGRSPPPGDFLANIVFYAPVGLFGTVVGADTRTQRWSQKVLLASSALSISNELMQYYVGRQTSAFDVVANTLGALLGALIAILWLQTRRPPA